ANVPSSGGSSALPWILLLTSIIPPGGEVRASHSSLLKVCVRASGVAPALKAASFRRPVHEAFHMLAVLPGEVKESPRGEIGSFFPEKSLKAPSHIGAFPRLESISASSI